MSDYERDYAKVLVKTWTDDAYKARLIKNPRQALKEEGFDVPEEVTVTVTPGSSKTTLSLGLPARPPGLGDDELKDAAHHSGFCCTPLCCGD